MCFLSDQLIQWLIYSQKYSVNNNIQKYSHTHTARSKPGETIFCQGWQVAHAGFNSLESTIKAEPELLRVTTSSHAIPTHVQALSVPLPLSWERKQAAEHIFLKAQNRVGLCSLGESSLYNKLYHVSIITFVQI